jgi:hypothetical protein
MVLKSSARAKAIIVDTWWQTETGGFLCSTLPAIKPMKPGSAGPGMPGIHPIIYDDEGKEVPAAPARPATSASRTPGRAVPDHLGRPRPFRGHLLRPLLQGPGQQGLARLALHDR